MPSGYHKDCPSLEEKAMNPNEQALVDLSAGILSPQSSVDVTSRDRAMVTEGRRLD